MFFVKIVMIYGKIYKHSENMHGLCKNMLDFYKKYTWFLQKYKCQGAQKTINITTPVPPARVRTAKDDSSKGWGLSRPTR